MASVNEIYQSKLQQVQERIATRMGNADMASSLFSNILGEASAAQAYAAYEPTSTYYGSSSTEYDAYINAAAQKYDLDPNLIRAVIQTESSFNAGAVSSAGAQGLMQLMPGTARGLGVTDSFDPQQNIDAGAKYIRQQIDRFGDVRLALAAYNTGPGRIASLGITNANDATQYSKISSGVRGYVDKVLGYYQGYSGR